MMYASLFAKEKQPSPVERLQIIIANDKNALRDDAKQIRHAIHQRLATPQALAVAFGVGFLAAHRRPWSKPPGGKKGGKKFKYIFELARAFAVPLLFAEE